MLVQINDYTYINPQHVTGIKLDSDISVVYFVGEPNGCTYSRKEGEILLMAMQEPAQKNLDNIREAIVKYARTCYEESTLSNAGIVYESSDNMLEDIMDTIKGGLYGI